MKGKGVGSPLEKLSIPFILYQAVAASSALPPGIKTNRLMALPRCSMETGSPA